MIKKENLKKKGWNDNEIEKAVKILHSKKNKKNINRKKRFHLSLFWLSLFVLVLANFIVLIRFVPFVLSITKDLAYLVIGSFGLVFGSLFSSIIMELEHLKTKHHVFVVFFFPSITIINLVVLISVMKINQYQGLGYPDILLMSGIYAILFLIPYSLYHLINIKDKKIL